MKNKYGITVGLILILSLILSACTSLPTDSSNENNSNVEALNEKIEGLTEENKQLKSKNQELEAELENVSNQPEPATSVSLWDVGQDVMELIKDKNMVELSNYVHPTKGLRFTPYVFTNLTFDQVFTPAEVSDLPNDTEEYDWGYYYGTPTETKIMLNFNDYYDEFIYDEDFLNTNIVGVNAVVSYGDIIDNIANEYPDAEYLEYYIVTSQDNNNIYWRSLKLVFEKVSEEYKLVAIIHGQWSDIYGVE